MTTPWAEIHEARRRASVVTDSTVPSSAEEVLAAGGDSEGDAGAWLRMTVDVDGHSVPRWGFVALVIVVLLKGPSALGFLALATGGYFAYTRGYLQGHTPESLWERYKAHCATLIPQKAKKGGDRSRSKHNR
jgi:hypothetical protein